LNTSKYDPIRNTLAFDFDTYVLEGDRLVDNFTEIHTVRAHSPTEMTLHLKRNDFTILDIVENGSLEPPKADSFRLMAIAQKL
jgi:hypothetical protein